MHTVPVPLYDLTALIEAVKRISEAPNRLLYTVDNAAAVLSIGRVKLYDMMKKGEIAFVYVGSDRRIPVEELKRIATEGAPGSKKVVPVKTKSSLV